MTALGPCTYRINYGMARWQPCGLSGIELHVQLDSREPFRSRAPGPRCKRHSAVALAAVAEKRAARRQLQGPPPHKKTVAAPSA